MTLQLIKTVDSDSWIKVSGQLTISDFRKLQTLGELSLEWFGQYRVLIELEEF
ncbi:MAG: STAS/SEC14 domain-containing protein [Methylosarcina sp.]